MLLSDQNDADAAKTSLDATLHHWKDGKPICCRNWIEQIIDEVKPLANELNILDLLAPIYSVLDNGNQSMKWLASYRKGQSIQELLRESIVQMEQEEVSSFSSEAI